LPLTDQDILRIKQRTGDDPRTYVRWIDRDGIDMDDEPEAFVKLRQGKRVMVMRQGKGGCHYLGSDDRCTIYGSRPLGCRIFPFDPSYTRQGKLRRLKLIQATDCQYELDGANNPEAVQDLHTRHEAATQRYQERIAEWNKQQARRIRQGGTAQSAAEFLSFLGVI
jgi:Fe-S-cluster containining protein